MAIIEREIEAESVHFMRFFSLLTFPTCFPTTGFLKLVVTEQKLFVVDRLIVTGLITSLLQTWLDKNNTRHSAFFKEFSMGGGGQNKKKRQNEKYEALRFGERTSLKRDFVKL